jgi:putative addiction module component (TIGR02574 family)
MSTRKHDVAPDTVEALKPRLAELSVQDRAELVDFLIRSLDEGVDEDAEAAWDAELDRRMAEISSGQAVGEPAAKVFVELREKYR